jgi:dehydrogenase/reductase SDR family member 12
VATYEDTIQSDWTADETFGYLAEFSNAEQWDPGVLEGSQLDPGPVRAGMRFRIVVPFGGRRLALIYHVTSYSPRDRQVVLEARSRLLRAVDTITVTPSTAGPSAESSVVSYRAEVTLRGPLGLADPLLARGFRTVGGRAAKRLAGALSRPRGAQGPAAPATGQSALAPSQAAAHGKPTTTAQ